MSYGLEAPAAVPVEIRAEGRRVFRLSRAIGDEGLRLERPAPFEPGRPVDVSFRLPDGDETLPLRAEIEVLGDEAEQAGRTGGCGLRFIGLLPERRAALQEYVMARLGLPRLAS